MKTHRKKDKANNVCHCCLWTLRRQTHAKKHHIVRGKCSQAVGQKCEYTLLESALKHTHHERTKAHVTVVTDTHSIIEMSTSVVFPASPGSPHSSSHDWKNRERWKEEGGGKLVNQEV